MVVIAFKDLRPVGHGLFADNESYMSELSAEDELSITGGKVSSVMSFSLGLSVGSLLVTIVTAITVM